MREIIVTALLLSLVRIVALLLALILPAWSLYRAGHELALFAYLVGLVALSYAGEAWLRRR